MKNLEGMIFGRLTAIKPEGRTNSGNIKWLCQCECGNTCIVAGGELTKGSTKSCGCYRREYMASKNLKNLEGMVFGRLKVLEIAEPTNSGNVKWKCQCECGNIVNVLSTNLVQGDTISCGCYKKESVSKRFKTHGYSTGDNSRIYRIWNGMKQRCTNPNLSESKYYLNKGILVCEDWNSFENFLLWAVSNGYADDLEIDRINNDGNYEPNNCRWVTTKENSWNKRNNKNIAVDGIVMPISGWADKINVPKSTIRLWLSKGADYAVEKIRGKLSKQS